VPRFYILADDVILRDERHYLDSDARFFFYARENLTVYVSASTFEMLQDLTRSQPAEDAWSYYTARCQVNGDVADRGEFDSFWQSLLDRGVIEQCAASVVRERPLSNLSLTPSDTAAIKPMTFASRVSLVVTMRCNLACKHCLRESSPLLKGEGELRTHELLSLIDELDANGVTSLQLSGGEVTVRKDIEVIAQHLKNLRCHVQFLTNGFVLRPSLVDILQDVQRAKGKGFFVHLSLDGGTAETNDWLRGKRAFDRTIDAMESLRDAGITVVVETCLMPSNLGQIELVAALCAERGVSQLTFHPISYTGRAGCNPLFVPLPMVNEANRRAAELAPSYAGRMKIDFGHQFAPHGRNGDGDNLRLPPNTTGAGMFHMAIAADGKVYPCIESVGAPSLVMGDVRTDSTADIWRSERWDIFRGGWTLDELEGCRGCIFDRQCATQACRCYAVSSGTGFYSPFKDCYANSDILWGGKTS
jgi:radical SAM protein with 4Fe4S-binding SPASM domain